MQGVTIGYLAVPVWHLTQGARLAPRGPEQAGLVAPADSVTIAAVVDAQGARVDAHGADDSPGPHRSVTGADSSPRLARGFEQTLDALEFNG